MNFIQPVVCVSRNGLRALLVWFLAVCVSASAEAAGTLTGTVFRDFDADGVDAGALEPGVGGVTVSAFDASGTPAGSTTTCSATGTPGAFCTLSNLGFFNLIVSGTGPYRVEFSGGPSALRSGAVGASSGTRVQFVADPAGGVVANVDVGLANPAQYCLPDTRMAAPCYVNGDPLTAPPGACPGGGAPASDFDAFVTFLDSVDSNDGTGVSHVANAGVLGSVWGVAWQRSSRSLFAGATIKRHSGLGPLPAGSSGSRTGVIYRLSGDLAGENSATVEAWFNLDDIPGVDTGAEPASRGLDPCTTEPNYDPNAFDAVGKVGLGDLDISEDDQTLWVMNLFDRTLYEITIGNPPQVPTDGDVTAHAFGPAEPSCTGGVFRPWAVKVHDGLVYVGGVCTGESGGTTDNLTAHVLSHDPTGATGNFAEVFQMDLDYPRGKVSDQGANEPLASWRPWIDEWADITGPAPGAGPFGQTLYPQAILSDLEFDIDGSLLLGFLDRAGNQLGNRNFQTDGVDGTTYEGVVGGDLMRVCFDPDDSDGNGNSFVLEFEADCPGPGGPTLAADQVPPQGPGGREYYWADYYRLDNNPNDPNAGTHQEIALGGLAHRFGSGEVSSSAFDAYDDFLAGGVVWMSQTSGARTHSLEVFGQSQGGQPATFGKSAGIGDLELLCDPAPLELGNRVWCDDGDGSQEGGEAVVPGVEVVLQCGSDSAVTKTTGTNGQYLFTDGDYQAVNGTRIPRAAACTISIDQVANSAVLVAACGGPVMPTTPNIGGGSNPDLNDSDGIERGAGIVEIMVPDTGGDGENNHTHDFGFTLVPPVLGSIGDTVWCDGIEGTGNGVFDSGEGVPGVMVSLFADSNCDNAADGAAISTAMTAGDGQYLFDSLTVGAPGSPVCYVVRVDAADPDLGICNLPITPLETAPDLDENTPDDLENDFGFEEPIPPTGSIGDTVWCDGLEGTGNGVFDSGEGLPGVTVSLFADSNCDNVADGAAISTAMTVGDGQYLFDDLAIGTPGSPVCYVVRVDAADPDLGTCNLPITPLETTPDLDENTPDDLENDFGFEEPIPPTGSIGDTVWCDGLEGTGNGVFDSGEGLPGVTVSLFADSNCDNAADGAAISTAITVGDGQYLFDDLTIGTPGSPVCYVVRVDAADPDLGTCNVPITPVETAPDLDEDTPDDLENDFGFEEPCVDPDGDGLCNESCEDDRDGDGDPDCTDFDPQGYFYCEDTGDILPGGFISVLGPGTVTISEDGANGRYAFVTDGTPGLYEMVVTPPVGFPLSVSCLEEGTLDPTGNPSPLALGSGEVLDSGVLGSSDCVDNPFYLGFELEAGDPLIINNNIPLMSCGTPPADIPTVSEWGLMLLALLLAGAGALTLRLWKPA